MVQRPAWNGAPPIHLFLSEHLQTGFITKYLWKIFENFIFRFCLKYSPLSFRLAKYPLKIMLLKCAFSILFSIKFFTTLFIAMERMSFLSMKVNSII